MKPWFSFAPKERRHPKRLVPPAWLFSKLHLRTPVMAYERDGSGPVKFFAPHLKEGRYSLVCYTRGSWGVWVDVDSGFNHVVLPKVHKLFSRAVAA